MALTQTDWVETFVNGVYTAVCTVVSTTAETDAYTLKTKKGLDPSKPWALFYEASATPDAQAIPVDIWIGHKSTFALSGQGANVVASGLGSNFKQIMNDAVLAVTPIAYSWAFDPLQQVADVVTVAAIATGLKVKIPVAPHYAFNIDGGSTLAAVTHTFRITQKTEKEGA